jgi:hypothetical protein
MRGCSTSRSSPSAARRRRTTAERQ